MKRGKKADAPDVKTLVAAIRAAVKKMPEGKPLTMDEFTSMTKFGEKDIFRYFARWNDALREAGFSFRHWNSPVTSDELLADWGRLVRELRGLPTGKEYRVRGNHAGSSLVRRFDGWEKLPDAFRAFAGSAKEWSDVVALLPPKGACTKLRPGRRRIYPRSVRDGGERRAVRLPARAICGPPIEFAELRNAPANEAGVVFLFGTMARGLGFRVDSVQAGFPDCEAKRLIAPETWQNVRIEFEFQSRNFHTHRHDPKGCDLIVCWENNWPECPIEVMALKDEVQRRKN